MTTANRPEAATVVMTNARTNRAIFTLAALAAIYLMALGTIGLVFTISSVGHLTEIAKTNHTNGAIVRDCTTPPPHPKDDPYPSCYEDGYARSLDCVGWLVWGVTPPTCEDVRARVQSLYPGHLYPPRPGSQ
jgi:hypothetical protein